jgi:predicted O-methyltransferase YrrM
MNVVSRILQQPFKFKHKKTLNAIADYLDIQGWLTHQEAVGLFTLANSLGPGSVVVEIGSWKGKSTYCLAKGLNNGRIYAIDPFNAVGEEGSREAYEQTRGEMDLFDQFLHTLNKYGIAGKVEPLKGYSNDFINKFPAIHLLFIDGDHSIEGCDFDFVHYSPHVVRGGFVAFHDFDPRRDNLGPTWVIKNKIMNNPHYEFYRKYDSLWIAKKIGGA